MGPLNLQCGRSSCSSPCGDGILSDQRGQQRTELDWDAMLRCKPPYEDPCGSCGGVSWYAIERLPLTIKQNTDQASNNTHTHRVPLNPFPFVTPMQSITSF